MQLLGSHEVVPTAEYELRQPSHMRHPRLTQTPQSQWISEVVGRLMRHFVRCNETHGRRRALDRVSQEGLGDRGSRSFVAAVTLLGFSQVAVQAVGRGSRHPQECRGLRHLSIRGLKGIPKKSRIPSPPTPDRGVPAFASLITRIVYRSST